MDFRREEVRNTYLENTSVENIFLAEYMPDAEGVFLKVYLTALMYAGSREMSNGRIARHLGIDEEDVLQAWNYWEKCGVIRKHYLSVDDRFHYNVEFLNLKSKIYSPTPAGNGTAADAALPEMDDQVLRDTFASLEAVTGRLLESREPESILSWIYDDHLEPEFILFAYKYCVEKRGNTHFKYIASVIREWLREGIRSAETAAEMLEETDQKAGRQRRVMKALGFRRNPTEAESRKIDMWFDELGFGMDRVLEACAKTAGISNPNINYVNTILLAWSREGKGGAAPAPAGGRKNAVQLAKQSYEERRQFHREELEERIREIRKKIPRVPEIENALQKASVSLTKTALGRNRGGEDAETLENRIRRLNEEKAMLLREAGYPEDYLELHYDCPICRDTGVTEDGERCRCFGEKLQQFLKTS